MLKHFPSPQDGELKTAPCKTMAFRNLAICTALFAGATRAQTEIIDVKYYGRLDLAPFACTDVSRSGFINRACYAARVLAEVTTGSKRPAPSGRHYPSLASRWTPNGTASMSAQEGEAAGLRGRLSRTFETTPRI